MEDRSCDMCCTNESNQVNTFWAWAHKHPVALCFVAFVVGSLLQTAISTAQCAL